jgi:CheY-like chemotaxis protein
MKKILLVEDNDMNRDMMSRLLKRWGYEVLVASDGGSAVDLAVSEHPDLVLMDISLPGIDGFEATERIRSTPEGKDLPVIALTAYMMEEDRIRALAVGCCGFETKPIDFQRLQETLRACLA